MKTSDRINDARELHAFIPSSLDELNLSLEAFRVYCHLVRRAGKDNTAYPSYAKIGETCFRGSYPNSSEACLKAKAIAAVRELIACGLIRKEFYNEGEGYSHNIYHLTNSVEWRESNVNLDSPNIRKGRTGLSRKTTRLTGITDEKTVNGDNSVNGDNLSRLTGITPSVIPTPPKGNPVKGIHKGNPNSMSCFDKHDSIAALSVLDSEPEVHRNLPETQQVDHPPFGKAEVTRQGGSSGAAKNFQKSKNKPKADVIYASLRSRETFEKFWKWYRDEICSIAQAKPGDKAEAAKAWYQLEISDFLGCGLEGFRLGCHLAKKAAIAAKGVGTKHACRFLGGGELGEPEWFTLHQEREDKGDNDFLTGVDVANDIAAVRVAIAGELKRLDMSGVLPDVWQQRTGVASAARLDMNQSLEYLKYLRGLSHANAAA